MVTNSIHMEQKIDLFTPIHKAIRALLYDMGTQLQAADFGSGQESSETLNRMEHILELLEEHARHEDQFIFPEIEKVAPGSTIESEDEHRQYAQKVERLHLQMAKIRHLTAPAKRIAASEVLNRIYTDFMGFYLMHMNHEEETVLPASQQKLSNEQLAAIRVKVQLDTAPDRYTEWLHWMLPSLNIHELVPLYQQVKSSAPAPVFGKFRDIGRKTIASGRWDQLCELADVK